MLRFYSILFLCLLCVAGLVRNANPSVGQTGRDKQSAGETAAETVASFLSLTAEIVYLHKYIHINCYCGEKNLFHIADVYAGYCSNKSR